MTSIHGTSGSISPLDFVSCTYSSWTLFRAASTKQQTHKKNHGMEDDAKLARMGRKTVVKDHTKSVELVVHRRLLQWICKGLLHSQVAARSKRPYFSSTRGVFFIHLRRRKKPSRYARSTNSNVAKSFSDVCGTPSTPWCFLYVSMNRS